MPVRLLAVGDGQSVGVSLGEETRVSAAVVADREGSSAEVDDLDEVRMTDVFTGVVVVASMRSVHSAGRHRPRRVACCVRHDHLQPRPGRSPDVLPSRSTGDGPLILRLHDRMGTFEAFHIAHRAPAGPRGGAETTLIRIAAPRSRGCRVRHQRCRGGGSSGLPSGVPWLAEVPACRPAGRRRPDRAVHQPALHRPCPAGPGLARNRAAPTASLGIFKDVGGQPLGSGRS